MEIHRRALTLLNVMRRPDLAEKELRRHLSRNSEDGYALSLLASILGKQQRYAEADEALAHALRLTPDSDFTHNVRGCNFEVRGMYPEAEETFRDALRLNPSNIISHAGLADALNRQGKYAEALAAVQKGLEIEPDHIGCLNCRAQVLFNLRRYRQAKNTLEEALRINPTAAATHGNLAVVREEYGQGLQAVECYRTALELDPGDEWAQEQVRRIVSEIASVRASYVMKFFLVATVLPLCPLVVLIGSGVHEGPARGILCTLLTSIAWWISFCLRYHSFRLALVSLTPWGKLLATPTQLRRTQFLAAVMAFFALVAITCGCLGWLVPWVAHTSVVAVFVLGVPLIVTLPGANGGSLGLRLGLALIPAAIAVFVFLNIVWQWPRQWLLWSILAYAAALLIPAIGLRIMSKPTRFL